MSKLIQLSVLLLTLTVSATAQIQKSSNNRVHVDEDYEHTEVARRTISITRVIPKLSRLCRSV